MEKLLLAALFAACCAGCFQASDDDMDLRTVPVTNNPYVVPNHGGSLPGSNPSSGPY